jgi:hypothetical protein
MDNWQARLIEEAATADTHEMLWLSCIYEEKLAALSPRERERLMEQIQDARREAEECDEK